MKKIFDTAWMRGTGIYLLAAALFLGKTYIFYSQMYLAGLELAFSIASLGILSLVCGALRCVSPKAARVAFWFLYALCSLLMGIDSTYFAYAARLPSFSQLGMAQYLPDVTDTIITLIGWKQISAVIDLPLWFLYRINRKTSLPEKASSLKKSWKTWGCFGCTLAGGLILAGWTLWGSFHPAYITNEIFCYHATDIYTALAETYTDETVDKSQYTLRDDSDSSWFGMAQGRNVFILQIEALQNFVLGATYQGQELTPNLNRLLSEETVYFSHYYYQIGGGNTADAEFTVNNSLFAPEAEAAYVRYPDNTYYGLPWLLKDNGYSGAHVFHNYKKSFWNRDYAYDNQGFDSYTALEDFEEIDVFPMGISDREMFRQSMDILTSYEEPFYAFYITVSSHHPYAIPLKDRGITLLPEDEGTLFGLYLHAVNYVDTVLGEWFAMLQEAGLYENSVFLIYGDHYALTNTDSTIRSQVSDMLGRDYTIYDVFNVPLLIHMPGTGVNETIEVAGGHVDVLPTLLCLLGINDVKTVMFGQNLLTAQTGLVCEQTHMSIGSFITNDLFFKKPFNNLLANYSVYRYGTMEMLSPGPYISLSDMAAKRIRDCALLLQENDLLLP